MIRSSFFHCFRKFFSRCSSKRTQLHLIFQKEKLSKKSDHPGIIIKKRMNPQNFPHYPCEQFFSFLSGFCVFQSILHIIIQFFHFYRNLMESNRLKISHLYIMFSIFSCFLKKIFTQQLMKNT